MNCYVHGDREATTLLNIPCANLDGVPPGKIPVCDECNADRSVAAQKYFASHAQTMREFRTRDRARNN
jgi:hypothetical protein